LTDFREMNLKPELVESLNRVGFVSATEVQERAIPELMRGKNLIVRAKTGTGKTAAFLIPILQATNGARATEAIIIVPTRELALQITNFAQQIGRPLHVNTIAVYGGASINAQLGALRLSPEILVGTPGRILDLLKRGALNLDRVKYLVLDEADIMLDMGFIDDVERIISRIPRTRQTMLFSATISNQVARIAEKYSNSATERIVIGKEEEPVVQTIKHLYTMVPFRLKYSCLLAYIKEYAPKKAIIFARTKFEANSINRVLLSQNYNVILMHGGLTQSAREKALASFRNGAQFLIATNIASRGLDIPDISDIINFGAPDDPRVYVHRVGRSARMGKEGRAATIADLEQKNALLDIEDEANITLHEIKLDLSPFEHLWLPIKEKRGGSGQRGRFPERKEFERHPKVGFGSRNRHRPGMRKQFGFQNR
jgi:ATP-dependent RNA helicase DeaD